MFTLRYFSFDDPVTGNTTKGYGYSYSKSVQNVVVKHVKDVPTVLKNDLVEQAGEVVPRYTNIKELSQKEFDALDVSGESLVSQLSREKNFLKLKKIEERIAKKTVVSSDDLVEAFTKLL